MKEIVPLPSKERDLLIQRFKDMIYATIYGGILIAMIQGILGGLSFWALDFPSPIFWGTAMALLSFIPIGGTALIWAPAAIILLIGGAILKGLILLGVGVFVISMVDNLLRPFFISSQNQYPSFAPLLCCLRRDPGFWINRCGGRTFDRHPLSDADRNLYSRIWV